MSPTASSSGATSTPTRERPTNSSSHLSPAAPSQRSVTNPSASPNAPNTNLPSAGIPNSSLATVEALLKQHASAQYPPLAALEQAVNERNVLSGQNAQLWKLIEKQRSGYNQVLKDLERVRGERDSYKAKLNAVVNGHIERKRDPHRNGSIESSAGRPSDDHGHTRDAPVRHNSDHQATPRLTHHHPSLHTSRSHEPLSPPARDASLQNSTNSASRPQTPPNEPTTAPPRSHQKPHPPPLVVPPRSESLPVPTSASTISHENSTSAKQTISTNEHAIHNGDTSYSQSTIRASSHNRSLDDSDIVHNESTSTPSPIVHITHQSPPGGTSTALPLSSNDHPHMDRNSTQPPPTNATSLATPAQHTQTSTQDNLLLTAPVPALSRDSRITLPDEAKRYIANMPDSPLSPHHGDVFTPRPLQSGQQAPHPLSQSTTAEAGLAPPNGESRTDGSPVADSEFLDLDSDHPEGEDEDLIESGKESWASHSQQISSDQHEVSANHSPPHGRKGKSRATPEDFPLPPSNAPVPMQNAHANASSELNHASSESSHFTTNNTLVDTESYSQTLQHQHSPMQSVRNEPPHRDAVPASFRALPLLSSDLPYTTIFVSHSFVRPNDRGKEVLSFVIQVNPGNNKEAWRVEKMYSDVLALDHRVRSSVGKGVAKRIVTLPEGKLWKDHAPAKVDQRKAVLEQYLQSLIKLPVKNNDEVVAFFTSDIVRETKQPVMQAGHKEGYLTKRGKNFGGWKTRYFVLQGPVLEYYDCRGGTHLGSILITGAQIGRQQRTDKPSQTDEEKEYRHAFLIVEAKKGPGGNHPRHVLCAESDEDRDNWVEMLVRYFSGTYTEDPLNYGAGNPDAGAYQGSLVQARPSMGDLPRRATRGLNKDDITVSRPLPIASDGKSPMDDQSSASIRTTDSSPIDRTIGGFYESYNTRKTTTQALPSSLPDSSPLSAAATFSPDGASSGQRANSELGHYPDHSDPRAAPAGQPPRQQSPERHRNRDPYNDRKTFQPTLPTVPSPSVTAHSDRPPSPERDPTNMPTPLASTGRIKISGPMNGAPIPQGFKFGGKDSPLETANTSNATNDRREKAKSRSFWGFGKTGLMGERSPQPVATYVPRAVFGVTLEDALDVAQIANLPAIVFRTIQYLEAKKADQEEGIYRLSGSSAVIKSLRDRFNAEGDVDLLASDEYWDPHAIAGLLKSFLRELPASILTRELHLKFLSVIDFIDAQERIRELSQLIAALPLANYSLLRALTAHLILIVQNSGVNKMTMRNVGIVFSPTLGIPAGVFSLMLGEFNRVFNVDGINGDSSLSEGPDEPDRRNSRQYSDAAADQLLGFAGRSLKLSTSSTATTMTTEESQSDADSFSVHDESGAETTEGEQTMESSGGAEVPRNRAVRVSLPATPKDTLNLAGKPTKASHTAASRGLNVQVIPSERGNRHSRMLPVGLPSSPRPPHSPSPPQMPQAHQAPEFGARE